MTSENTSSSQRKIRYTVYLNEDENTQLRNDAINEKGFGPKAVGRYIREQVLASLSIAESGPSIIIPPVNEQSAKDLRGAVVNLNQTVRVLNTIAMSSSIGTQLEHANKVYKNTLIISKRCKNLFDFSSGNVENKNALKMLATEQLEIADVESILASMKKRAK